MAILLRKGDRVRSYKVIKYLSGGGEGTTYLAEDDKGNLVVLKQHACSASSPAGRASAKRIERRRALIGKRHPYVATTLDIFVEGDLYYEVLELVTGEPLDKRLERGDRLTERQAESLASCILHALQWLHRELAVAHRDIKPGNTMVRGASDGKLEAILIDLGIAVFLKHSRVTTTGFVGTYAYAPPEVLAGPDEKIDGRADLYALGIMLFETLTGRLPFESTSDAGLIREICSPHRRKVSEFVPGISPTFDAFVTRLMNPVPDHRYSSAEEALSALSGGTGTGRTSDARLKTPAAKDARVAGPDGTAAGFEVLSGPRSGCIVRIPGEGLTIGREDINPRDLKVSRIHARVTTAGKKLVLADLRSVNGLISRGKRRRKVKLSVGECVTLGATTLACREKGR